MAEAVILVHMPSPIEGAPAEEFLRPPEFAKKSTYPEVSDDEESTVGKMPPSDDSDGQE